MVVWETCGGVSRFSAACLLFLSRICFRFCSVSTLDAVVASDPPHCWSLVVLAYRCAPVVATLYMLNCFSGPCPHQLRVHVERVPHFLWDEEQVRVPSLLRHSRCAPASLLVVCCNGTPRAHVERLSPFGDADPHTSNPVHVR